ncbi:MAG: hypothetical protein IIA73_02515 [Proteobacteria bacterium]|nr:hypothetical protein [Pseudomonadota bacterium]
MTERDSTRGESPLFARKGEAIPAPAVAFVSLRQLQGKPDERGGEPDRRAQQHDGGPVDGPERHGPDYGGRRHFTPSSGLAFDQQFVPWELPDGESGASEETATAPKAKRPVSSMSSMSSLIHRHGVGELRPASPTSEPALAPERVAATASPATPAPARKPPLIDPRRALSTPASPVPPPPLESPATPTRLPESEEPPRETRKRKRKKVTVRLEREQYARIKELAKRSGGTQQSVMAAAVAAYLNETP